MLVLFSLANSSDTFLLLRASDLGFSSWTVVLLYALFNLTYAVVSYPAGVLSDTIGRRRVIAVGWAIYAMVYVGLAVLPDSTAFGIGAAFAIVALLTLPIMRGRLSRSGAPAGPASPSAP